MSTQHNTKQLEQLKSVFKRTVNWKKYLSIVSTEKLKIDPSFQEVKWLFVLSFEDNSHWASFNWYYNVMIDGKILFDHPIKYIIRTYDSIRKIVTGQGDDYTTGCLLSYDYFQDYYNMISIDLSTQQALDADPKPIQKNNFRRNLAQERNLGTKISFIIEEAEEIVLDFSQGTVRVLKMSSYGISTAHSKMYFCLM